MNLFDLGPDKANYRRIDTRGVRRTDCGGRPALRIADGALKALAPVLIPLVPRLKLKGMGEEDKFFLYFALQAMHHATLIMYAPTLPSEIYERLPFVTFVGSVEEAIALAAQRVPGAAKVLAFPYGGSTYPILSVGKV